MIFLSFILFCLLILILIKVFLNNFFDAGILLINKKKYIPIKQELEKAGLKNNALICYRDSSFRINRIDKFPSKITPYSIDCKGEYTDKRYAVLRNTEICRLLDEKFKSLNRDNL